MRVSAEERRIVTVLFADMAGSTALGEELDPEEMRRLLARYYSIARDCVDQHGGSVEKFIGDAVMAVFGLTAAHGDDPDRAVAAAMTMRDRIRDDPFLKGRLVMRFGVSTGEVVASRDRSARDFLVTGDATNVAARLQEAAEPWGILVSDRTVRAATNFEFGDEVGVKARGKSSTVAARPVVGPRKAKAQCRVRQPAFDGQRHRPGRHGQDPTRGGVPQLAAEPRAGGDRGHRAVSALRPAADGLADAPGPVHADRHIGGHAARPGARRDLDLAAPDRGRGPRP